MGEEEDSLASVRTRLYEAELALHNGDAAPRRAEPTPLGGSELQRHRRLRASSRPSVC